MTDAFPDKMKAAREVLIGLNATDEQMSALADVFDFGADTIEALRAENERLQAKCEFIYDELLEAKGQVVKLRAALKRYEDEADSLRSHWPITHD